MKNIWINAILSSPLVPDHVRWALLRASGIRVQKSLIDPGCFIGSPRVVIGRGCSINRGVFLDGLADLIIGDGVSIGMNALIVTGSHEVGSAVKRAGELTRGPVQIGDGAWIGAGAVVLPGVTIGNGSIIGAGSVVMKDVAANTVVMGNPARLVRRLDNDGADAARLDEGANV
ncbi:acetyltransferase [Microbacterium sp. CH12i]|nr:acetyltransferase [Microbacterium sp. CH12i]